ncbi:hypothetical protein B5E84_14830 [Lachnoclostridium sp. An14]|uniref:hypothetical protein n=1 Tax=Lachnoclostridium sp. An14 TaxID=1965562 RepID=UPI000B3A4EDE|nr:hypothetical protein [Lachnoclostridium sp. An14]OUQ15492.1 hypothetical protein B5E84_14830 [Lachnoclostridium sp. An14]
MDYLTVEMPKYKPHYKRWKQYGWSSPSEKENTREVLLDAGKGYCMYCYTRILVAGKSYGQLEHAIEKNNSDWLVNCVPNIGIACPVCNESFKRRGEKGRKLRTGQIRRFHSSARCAAAGTRKQCTVPCKALRNLQADYYENEDAHFILQPMGAMGRSSRQELKIVYDILKTKFRPADNPLYDQMDKEFINAHIKRFCLNDPKYRTGKLMEFVRLVVDSRGELPDYECNNLVVELFAEKMKGLSQEKRLKVCEAIYIIEFAAV